VETQECACVVLYPRKRMVSVDNELGHEMRSNVLKTIMHIFTYNYPYIYTHARTHTFICVYIYSKMHTHGNQFATAHYDLYCTKTVSYCVKQASGRRNLPESLNGMSAVITLAVRGASHMGYTPVNCNTSTGGV